MILLLALGAGARGARALEQSIVRTYPEGAVHRLVLDTYRGRVEIVQSGDRGTRIALGVRVPTDDAGRAKEGFDTLQFDCVLDSGTLRVTARNPTQTEVRFDWTSDRRIDLVYRITLPRGCGALVTDRDGTIEVGPGEGDFEARMGSGTVYFRALEGSARVVSDGGDVIVSRCTGTVDVETRLGSIQVGTAGGHARLHTPRGWIEIQHALGGVDARSEAGDITLGLPVGLSGPSRVYADGGNVVARFEPGVACAVRASAVWGRVHTTLPFALTDGADGHRILEGTLSGGGPLVDVHADGGYANLVSDRPPPIRPRTTPVGAAPAGRS